MAQTRAISRVCRSAFAHVVVLIDKELSTTPAEEVPREEDEPPLSRPVSPAVAGFKKPRTTAMKEVDERGIPF
jgi:hypothetical protein